tara:strand:- start:300 stop:437 length:138 start_codon:yes stop_codon:yes gene_type:complete
MNGLNLSFRLRFLFRSRVLQMAITGNQIWFSTFDSGITVMGKTTG